MQFEGWRYCLGDFSICIGRATLKPKQEFRGFVAEVHYHPLDDNTIGSALLEVIIHHNQAASCQCSTFWPQAYAVEKSGP